jgi:hypothetical protein
VEISPLFNRGPLNGGLTVDAHRLPVSVYSTTNTSLINCESSRYTLIVTRSKTFLFTAGTKVVTEQEEVIIDQQVLGLETWDNVSFDYENHEPYNTEEQQPTQLLLNELGSLIGDIPDMEHFKVSDIPNKETIPEEDEPLFVGSPVSVSESALLIMAFAVRHKLSGVALQYLLSLVALHCPKPNKCIAEMNHFHHFFQALKHPIVKHYYCPNVKCKVYVGNSKPKSEDLCKLCHTKLEEATYFIEIPILEQLRTFLSSK